MPVEIFSSEVSPVPPSPKQNVSIDKTMETNTNIEIINTETKKNTKLKNLKVILMLTIVIVLLMIGYKVFYSK